MPMAKWKESTQAQFLNKKKNHEFKHNFPHFLFEILIEENIRKAFMKWLLEFSQCKFKQVREGTIEIIDLMIK